MGRRFENDNKKGKNEILEKENSRNNSSQFMCQFLQTVKKGRRAEQSPTSTTNLSSDSPSTPEFENNMNDGFLDDFSSGLDLKTVPMKLKKVGGWADEASRSGSSGKYACVPQLRTNHAINQYVPFYELQESFENQSK